jgi:hypothetical protein
VPSQQYTPSSLADGEVAILKTGSQQLHNIKVRKCIHLGLLKA